MDNKHHEAIQKEREKLNALVDEAIKNGTPIAETHAIMAQCIHIKRLVLRGKLEKYVREQRRVVRSNVFYDD